MNIYVIRHGQTNTDGSVNLDGYPDGSLTKVGLTQAHLTGKQLSKVAFNAIYSSDLKRALQTSEIVAGYHQNLQVTIDKQIREINMGVFHTSSSEQVSLDYPEFYAEFLKKATDFRYPKGESGEEVLVRTLNFLKSITLKEDDTLCIVCHGGVIRSLFSYLLGLPQYKRFNLHTFNCGISLLNYNVENSVFKVISINEISHLDIYTTY